MNILRAIIAFLTAAANYLAERAKNEKLRLISKTVTDLHNAKEIHYQLESAALTGPGESDRRDLAILRVQDLSRFLREIRPAASPEAGNPAGNNDADTRNDTPLPGG